MEIHKLWDQVLSWCKLGSES